jgi:hypothetical protein
MLLRTGRIGTGQRGEARLGCILWTLALAIALLIGWKMIPVKLRSVQLYDYMVEEAKFGNYSSPESIKKGILREARRLDLPVSEKKVKVERIGDRIRMKVSYTVPVEFPGYTYEWEFNHEVDRPLFIF